MTVIWTEISALRMRGEPTPVVPGANLPRADWTSKVVKVVFSVTVIDLSI